MAAEVNAQLEGDVPTLFGFEPITIEELQRRWLDHHEHVLRSAVRTIVRYRCATRHGRRAVDFRMLAADENRNEAVARIEALDTWRTPVVACTVDTVLGVIQNNRRGLFTWPAIAQAGFVFDEIHAYDDKLFDALLHFLENVRGVPILLMTASIQQHRLDAIKRVLATFGEELAEVTGPEDFETALRYVR